MNTDKEKHDPAEMLREELARILREEADLIAETILTGLRERIGGAEVYLPAPDPAGRRLQIRAAFNGRNLAEVMRQFGVSRATVYRALK